MTLAPILTMVALEKLKKEVRETRMIEAKIPGFGELTLQNAIFDYNGTLAIDGYLIEGLETKLNMLAQRLRIHIVTGDSFGTAKEELKNVNCELLIIPSDNQALAKKEYLHKLIPHETVAIGNGRNDQIMLKEAALGIAVLGDEGTATETLLAADLVINIFNVFDLLENKRRLVASLRA
jgi:P-type E1-E2 ATPase